MSVNGATVPTPDLDALLGSQTEAEAFAAMEAARDRNQISDGATVPGSENREGTDEELTRRLILTPASQVRIRKVRWLMANWVLLAGMTLLAGREGLGKSTIAVYIAALLTIGKLEGERYGTPGNVLYVATEDDPGYTVAPRFLAAGADMDRVFFLTVKTAHGDEGRVVLPMDLYDLEQMIVDNNITMIVLDAATSVMDSRLDGHDDRKVRQFLEPVSALAQRTETAFLGIVHFGKREGADTGKLILGSVAWSQVARSVLAVALDEDSGDLVITNTKKNLAPETHSASARIVSTTVHTEDGPAEVGRIEWLGETEADARQLLAGPDHDDDDAPARTEAEHWLHDYLEEQGQAAAKDVKSAAAKAKIAERTLKRAAKKIGVVYGSAGFPRTSTWSLPSGATSGNQVARACGGGPTGPTGVDQRERVGLTGADSQWGHGHERGLTVADSPETAKDSRAYVRAPSESLSGIGRAESIAERINRAPRCDVCGRPVTSEQGTTHLGCQRSAS